MKRSLLLIIILLFIASSPWVYAQEKRDEPRRPPNSRHHRLPRDCVPFRELNLSTDQSAAIKRIGRFYRRRFMNLSADLMERRLEFRRILRNPDIPMENIRFLWQEIETLETEMGRAKLDFYLEIRQVLSPEQIRSWCPLLDKPFGRKRGWRP